MKRTRDNHGFTIGELLIAVAIVAVLVAIALPLFTSSLADAKVSVDAANCRSARAAATTVCLIDHNGDFGEKSKEDWVQIALDAGIPRRSQVDPSQKLTCDIEDNDTRITFRYGEGSGSGDSNPGGDSDPSPTPGTDPDPPAPGGGAGSVTVTDSSGMKHEIKVTGNWEPIKNGSSNQVSVSPGSIFSDETGTYVVGWNDILNGVLGKTLAEVKQQGGFLIKIDENTRVWTDADFFDGKWSSAPQAGEIRVLNGEFYIAPSNVSQWDLTLSNWIKIVQ